MGLDLKLLPISGTSVRMNFSHSVIDVRRNYDLFDRVREIQSFPIRDFELISGERFTSYLGYCYKTGERKYGPTLMDSHGEPLRYAYAVQLAAAFDGATDPWNAAVGAFLRAMPGEQPICIFWC